MCLDKQAFNEWLTVTTPDQNTQNYVCSRKDGKQERIRCLPSLLFAPLVQLLWRTQGGKGTSHRSRKYLLERRQEVYEFFLGPEVGGSY